MPIGKLAKQRESMETNKQTGNNNQRGNSAALEQSINVSLTEIGYWFCSHVFADTP